MYCKVFTNQQVYDGMTEMNIACDNVFVTDGWICLYKDEKFVASFDMMTITGWVLIDSTADTPQTNCDTCKHYKLACELFSEVCKYEPTTQTETQNSNLTFDTPQTDCGWGKPTTVSHSEERTD